MDKEDVGRTEWLMTVSVRPGSYSKSHCRGRKKEEQGLEREYGLSVQ